MTLYHVVKVLEFLTNGNEAEIAKSWRMPKDMTNDGEDNDAWDDYSMFFGYDVPFKFFFIWYLLFYRFLFF